ncbi:Two-component sensor PilS [Cystobacter fuscus DSM 2262]|uniref:histidine kinase n=1 Tax=Cystobacter fuscus (strain ATCC 25194 / DSM 2262 / NBRC 100088 / M29) TaxID=1242864 RepID=S9NZA2_CYSF2|nr:ATP-binding protein [Cystobacter fuscus]EPX56181.1 Two-component sensor PilS [Cystobacter fuscus DSM 2262]
MRGGSRLSYTTRVTLLALASGLPGIIVALALLWRAQLDTTLKGAFILVVLGSWIALVHALREGIARPLRTLSNLLAALREGDYSVRGRLPSAGTLTNDPLAGLLLEFNFLSDTLREQRLGVLEADALLRQVMDEMDMALFAFDSTRHLRWLNRAGRQLLGEPAARLVDKTASELGLAGCLEGEVPRTLTGLFGGRSVPWELRRREFRQGGISHQLVVLTDLQRTLHEEERLAWQRLVRVLGHEINNSLTPIQSIASSLQELVQQTPPPEDWEEDVARGLSIIHRRSEALGRFMSAYARLAKLPPPRMVTVDVGAWVRRVAELESRLPVSVREGPAVSLQGDGDQLDQLLINLVRNAVDAAMETGGGVVLSWSLTASHVEVWVEDQGPGLSATTNLFVPFFTTKPAGSGIGLVLGRQIAESHRGSLSLENRTDERGCRARLRLPLRPSTSA